MKNRPATTLSRRSILSFCIGVGATPGGPRFARAQSGLSPLLTRPIPRTGEALPVIGLGTANGWDTSDDPVQRAARFAVFRALIAAGGKVVDTAPSYGRAESVVGDIVAQTGSRRGIFLATKLESYSRATGPSELQASLRRLRTDKVDLMQLHNVNDRHQDLGMLREWKARGVCRYTGITTTYHGDFDAAEAVLRREKPDFIEIDYSIEDREAEKRLLPTAAEIGAAVLIAQPLGEGHLFRAVRQRQLPEWASEFGAATWAQFFLKFLLGHPAVTSVIPGTSNPVHMQDDLAAGRGRPPTEAERRKMVEFFKSLG